MIRHCNKVAAVVVTTVIAALGCNPPSTPAPRSGGSNAPERADESGHVHERGKMLIVDMGEHHALLTAHLSPMGNELDMFFETADTKNPMPVAIPDAPFKAFAVLASSKEKRELLFEPAPAEERPKGEKKGACSHFAAKAPWLKPDEVLEQVVVPRLQTDEEVFRVAWKNFDPKKYAHHVE